MKERKLPFVRPGRVQCLALFLVVSLVCVAVRPASSTEAAPSAPAKKEKHDGEKIFRGLLFGEEGPISRKFPEIWQRPDVIEQMNTPAKARAWNSLKEKTVVRIKKKDPTFFKRFGDAMQSGDHFKIMEAFGEAGKLITETISTSGAAQIDRKGEARVVNASTNAAAAPAMETSCDGGICVTSDEYGNVYVDDDPAYYTEGGSQDATAMACSVIAVCAAAIALAVWKYAAVVDVAAVAYVAAVVVAIWKWKYKYSYSRMEIDSTHSFYQEEIVNAVAEELYYEDRPVEYQYQAYE